MVIIKIIQDYVWNSVAKCIDYLFKIVVFWGVFDCMGATEGSNLGGKMKFFSYQILFEIIKIWFSAAKNWKEFFNSDVWKWSYEQIKIPVLQIF